MAVAVTTDTEVRKLTKGEKPALVLPNPTLLHFGFVTEVEEHIAAVDGECKRYNAGNMKMMEALNNGFGSVIWPVIKEERSDLMQ